MTLPPPRRASTSPRGTPAPRKPRIEVRPGLFLPALLVVLQAGFALGAVTPKPAAKPTAPPLNSCTTCKERRATLDPALFAKADPEVKPAYEIAKKYPAMLDQLHCFCECAENPMFHHKTLLTCFVDTHAAGCGICLSEARLAAQLKEKGVSDEEIKITVEAVHRTDGHPPTN